jgi:hypothetical protein
MGPPSWPPRLPEVCASLSLKGLVELFQSSSGPNNNNISEPRIYEQHKQLLSCSLPRRWIVCSENELC